MAPQIAPYGTWRSQITAELVSAAGLRIGEIATVGDDLYWSEMRPEEGGRSVLMHKRGGTATELTPAGFNTRNRVHEYGGGAYLVDGDTVYMSNFADHQVYRQEPGGKPVPITPRGYRYADGVVDPQRRRIVYVREDHSVAGRTPVNTLVAVRMDVAAGETDAGEILVAGHDFYAAPRFSPAGDQLCWLAWSHPQMPWTAVTLWLTKVLPDGTLTEARCIAGAGGDESIFQPQWSPDGVLYFVSDRSNWWNLYRWRNETIEPVLPMAAEFGLPQWVFHMSTYGFLSADRIACCYTGAGESRLATIDLNAHQLTPLTTDYTDFSGVRTRAGRIVAVAAAPALPDTLVEVDPDSGAITVIKATSTLAVDPSWISTPQAVEFPTTGGLTAYGIYYPPLNPLFTAPPGEKPPLLVLSHGGPTAAVGTSLNYAIQYWTSRGFAVLDVNYGGSTGYGRDYRHRLDGNWGVVDVDDCANGAKFLAEQGLADPQRLIIRGGSAGGFTTLMALATTKTFAAGASYYGLSELESFVHDTHKFEARYLDSLVGPYPERRDLYVERSAMHYIDGFSCPVIFFQGLDDKIVPPSQAEVMVDALRRKKLPVAYVTYEGEDHGFRQARNQIHSLQSELYFYGRVFGFTPADEIEPVTIENL